MAKTDADAEADMEFIRKITSDNALMLKIYDNVFLNELMVERRLANSKEIKLISDYKKNNKEIVFRKVLNTLKTTTIVNNTELFQFEKTVYYWVFIYKLFKKSHRNVLVVSTNNNVADIYQYYANVFNIKINVTHIVPVWEFAGRKIPTDYISIKDKHIFYDAPEKMQLKTYEFIHYETKDIHGISYILQSLKNGGVLFITMSKAHDSWATLSSLVPYFKSYSLESIYDLDLYPHFLFEFPIVFYGYDKTKEFNIVPNQKFEHEVLKYNKYELGNYRKVLEHLKRNVELNLWDKEQTLRDAILFCHKWEIPLKPWIPTDNFLQGEYGVYLLGRLFSLDKNIVFYYDLASNSSNTRASNKEIYAVYEKLLHKFYLVGLPIDYVEKDVWWQINRRYRWYEKTLAQHLKSEHDIQIFGRMVSRAWLKMYEILKIYQFNSSKKVITTFHICEAPGNMMMAINYYITKILGKEHKWNAQSLVNSNITRNEYRIINKFPNRWNNGENKSGDITKIKNILYYRDKYRPMNIDWISSDCGHDFSKADETAQLHIAELLTTLLVLSPGGNFISKLYFPIVDVVIIDVLCFVVSKFKHVSMYKSYQNTWNTEVYLICMGYNYSPEIETQFVKFYNETFGAAPPGANANNRITKLSMVRHSNAIKPASKHFMLQLLSFSEQLYSTFSHSINRNLYYYDHIKKLDDALLKKMIDERNKQWIKLFIKN